MPRTLIALLGDGAHHSGEAIAASLGCSRTAVWKHIEALRGYGIGIEATAGRGYRLAEPMELLDEAHIVSGLPGPVVAALESLKILDSVDSTNDRLLALPARERHGKVLIAEHQTAGRGRQNRNWVSPFGRNIYLSLGWRFERGAADLGCLPLVLALAACDALDRVGLVGHGVKWPNDLQIAGRKLGGCLVEIQGDANGPCHAVLGIGLNACMPQSLSEAQGIAQPWASVAEFVEGLSRNRLAGELLGSIVTYILGFEARGFEPYGEEWNNRDVLAGRRITLQGPGGSVSGLVLGITGQGALRLQSAAGTAEYTGGEVSVC